jgi:hypothetical protein
LAHTARHVRPQTQASHDVCPRSSSSDAGPATSVGASSEATASPGPANWACAASAAAAAAAAAFCPASVSAYGMGADWCVMTTFALPRGSAWFSGSSDAPLTTPGSPGTVKGMLSAGRTRPLSDDAGGASDTSSVVAPSGCPPEVTTV